MKLASNLNQSEYTLVGMQKGGGKKKSTEAEVNAGGDGIQSASTQVAPLHSHDHVRHESAGVESYRQSHNH